MQNSNLHHPSIKKRLTTWLVYSFLCISILALMATSLFINHEINQHFDNILVHESHNIIDRLYINNSEIKFKNQHIGTILQTSFGDSSVFYSIQNSSNDLLFGFKNIPQPSHEYKDSILYDAKIYDQNVRAFQIRHTMVRNQQVYPVTITIAETLEDRKVILYKIYFILFIIIILIISSTLFFTLFAINKGFEPLNNLQHSIKKRDINDLTPIRETKIPIEVIALVQSINQLFRKLKKSFLNIKQFNQDVSHQLKTPLTELKMSIELDEAIDNKQRLLYISNINTMGRTIDQLLLHAHTNPDTFDCMQFKPFNLTDLCKKVAMNKTPLLYKYGIEMMFEAKQDFYINGSDTIMESLLNNLIDNAQKYAQPTHEGGRTILSFFIHEIEHKIVMNISDNGPGIPEKYLDKIFDRFFRIDTKTHGTGLGLSIVKQIVELHSGTIMLTNKASHGLNIDIEFPKYQPL